MILTKLLGLHVLLWELQGNVCVEIMHTTKRRCGFKLKVHRMYNV